MGYAVIIFLSIFVAELGDKTQVATLLFAANSQAHPLIVFASAGAALLLSTGLAVVAGAAADRYFSAIPLNLFAGIGFVGIGVLMIWQHSSSL